MRWRALPGARRRSTSPATRPLPVVARAAGRITLRLLARDSRRRITVVTRRLIVTPVALRLLRLQTQAHVGRHAHTAAIALSTTVPATLLVGGHSYRVGQHTRTVKAPLPRRPKIGILQLSLKISTRVPGQRALHVRIVLLRA